ncbi:MAG TPA: hypothetical protein VEX37_03830, partial [Thermomicrobiales bacterium]|nr:hypothetical protein [Thermomicrobiales bacterium]
MTSSTSRAVALAAALLLLLTMIVPATATGRQESDTTAQLGELRGVKHPVLDSTLASIAVDVKRGSLSPTVAARRSHVSRGTSVGTTVWAAR